MALVDKIETLAQAVAGDVKALQGELSGKQPLSPTLTNTTASFTTELKTRIENNFVESATAPESPSSGQRWLDTTTGIEYTWFEDGDSGQWVELGPGGSGPAGEDGKDGLNGQDAQWTQLTQAQYDAITPDPNTLYVIVG